MASRGTCLMSPFNHIVASTSRSGWVLRSIRLPRQAYHADSSRRPIGSQQVGCSSWKRGNHAKAGSPMQDVPSHTRAQGEASFMEEPDGCDELDGSAHDECDESSFTIDQVNPEDLKTPTELQRPKLPRSIKQLNKALGRKSVVAVPDDELIEQFVRGRGPGGQAINKTNSSVSLIHIPTGIRIQSQPTRSREQNRIAARHILSERLDELRGKGLYTPSPTGSPTKPDKDLASMTARQTKREGQRQQAVALADAYTKTELRAAKERARKANRAKKHRQKTKRQAEVEKE